MYTRLSVLSLRVFVQRRRAFDAKQSNPTFHIGVNTGGADDRVVEFVMRKKPSGKLLGNTSEKRRTFWSRTEFDVRRLRWIASASAHMVEREFRVMSALATVNFPVPRCHFLCTDRGVIGTEVGRGFSKNNNLSIFYFLMHRLTVLCCLFVVSSTSWTLSKVASSLTATCPS